MVCFKIHTKNKCIVNAYYQTENGGIISSPKFSDKTNKIPHGSAGRPVNKYIKINKLSGKKERV